MTIAHGLTEPGLVFLATKDPAFSCRLDISVCEAGYNVVASSFLAASGIGRHKAQFSKRQNHCEDQALGAIVQCNRCITLDRQNFL